MQSFSFTELYTEKPFWYQQIDIRQTRVLKSGRPNVDYEAGEKFCLHVTTMKAINFQFDIHSIPVDKFKNQYKQGFDSNSKQNHSEHVKTQN